MKGKSNIKAEVEVKDIPALRSVAEYYHLMGKNDEVLATCDEMAVASPGDARPFCMVVGWVLPHCPYICPKALFDEYYDTIDVPELCTTPPEPILSVFPFASSIRVSPLPRFISNLRPSAVVNRTSDGL